MREKNKNSSFITWFEDIWEEVEVQFYGITGAIMFFGLVYLFFKPTWMEPLVDFFYSIKLSFLCLNS